MTKIEKSHWKWTSVASLFFSIKPHLSGSRSSLKESQVRGWRVNIGVRAQISMEGMNYSTPAPLIYFTSAWEMRGGGEGGKWRCKTNLELILFLFPLGQPFQPTGDHKKTLLCIPQHVKMSPHKLDEYYRRKCSPSSEARLEYIASELQTDGLSRLRLLQCRSELCRSSSWCSKAEENRKLPHSGRAMMDAHCRATTAWPPYKTQTWLIKGSSSGMSVCVWVEAVRTIISICLLALDCRGVWLYIHISLNTNVYVVLHT